MIAIINQKQTKNGVATYHVSINEDFIATFKHKRTDGLATCLRKAATAVEDAIAVDEARIIELLK